MQMKRFIFAGILGLSMAAHGADTPHWTQPYNIVWTEPGTKGSIPCRPAAAISG